jgi:hypothetical protein
LTDRLSGKSLQSISGEMIDGLAPLSGGKNPHPPNYQLLTNYTLKADGAMGIFARL